MAKCLVCSMDDNSKFIDVGGYIYMTCHSCGGVFLPNIEVNEQKMRHSQPEYKRSRIKVEGKNARHNQWLVDEMSKRIPVGKVLDVGCGAGYLVRAMCDAGYEAEGVDLGEENIKFASETLNVTVTNEDFLTLNNSYDVISIHQVIEHLPNPGDYISKAHALLPVNGWLVITTPNLSLAKKLAKLPRPILGDALGHPPNHCVLFEPRTIRW